MSVQSLAAVVVKEVGCSNAAAMRAVSALFKSISETTELDRNVVIKGFGTFRRSMRIARRYDTRDGIVNKPDRIFLTFRCVSSQKKAA